MDGLWPELIVELKGCTSFSFTLLPFLVFFSWGYPLLHKRICGDVSLSTSDCFTFHFRSFPLCGRKSVFVLIWHSSDSLLSFALALCIIWVRWNKSRSLAFNSHSLHCFTMVTPTLDSCWLSSWSALPCSLLSIQRFFCVSLLCTCFSTPEMSAQDSPAAVATLSIDMVSVKLPPSTRRGRWLVPSIQGPVWDLRCLIQWHSFLALDGLFGRWDCVMDQLCPQGSWTR